MSGARSQGLFGALNRGGLVVGGRSLTSSLNVEWCARESSCRAGGQALSQQVAGGCMRCDMMRCLLAAQMHVSEASFTD
jgi:hypothetical protein